MNVATYVYQNLAAYAPLMSLLHRDKKGQAVYHLRSPDAGSYPCLVFSVISDVPAVFVDGCEIERRVTVRIHILTKTGRSEQIEKILSGKMFALGFVRLQTNEFLEDGVYMTVVDYAIGRGADD